MYVHTCTDRIIRALPAAISWMNENSSYPILNPNTYLSYLEPTIANEYEVARDIFFATFGVTEGPPLAGMMTDSTIIGSLM